MPGNRLHHISPLNFATVKTCSGVISIKEKLVKLWSRMHREGTLGLPGRPAAEICSSGPPTALPSEIIGFWVAPG